MWIMADDMREMYVTGILTLYVQVQWIALAVALLIIADARVNPSSTASDALQHQALITYYRSGRRVVIQRIALRMRNQTEVTCLLGAACANQLAGNPAAQVIDYSGPQRNRRQSPKIKKSRKLAPENRSQFNLGPTTQLFFVTRHKQTPRFARVGVSV